MWHSFVTSMFFQFPFGHSSRLCFPIAALYCWVFFPPQNMNFVLMRSMIGMFYSRSFSSQSQTAVGLAAMQVWRSPACCGDSQCYSPKPVLCAWDLVHLHNSLVVWNQGIKWKWNRNNTSVTGPRTYSCSILFGAHSLTQLVLFFIVVAKRWQLLGLGITHRFLNSSFEARCRGVKAHVAKEQGANRTE